MKPVHIPLLLVSMILLSKVSHAQHHEITTIIDPLVEQNVFIKKIPNKLKPPVFEISKTKLPVPIWPNRPDVIKCYWKAWELAFSNIHGVTKENNFVSPYIDPAFNGHIFMWDTSFMVLFGRYGQMAFDFQGSLNNFYSNQHKDGYICREINTSNGAEIFEKFDPSSTGPNLIPWAEWEYYQNFNDKERLKIIFGPLLAYYHWFRANRSWPDGTYFSTGWGCGMDNQPRVPKEYNKEFSPAFMSWIDTSLQEIFAGKILILMAAQLNRTAEVTAIKTEIEQLTKFLQQNMWEEKTSFFYDRYRDGTLSKVKSIAAYWALLAEAVPKNRVDKFIAHLKNPNEFARLHRVPTLSADDPGFKPEGDYWNGGVWAPTSYLVLRGLTQYKQDSLAFEIAYNHLDNVVKVYNQTGTLWENYAPDSVKGKYRKDMVGWTGLVPISVLFEYVFGIRPDVPKNRITWDIRLLDEFGVKQYPYAAHGMIDFFCAKREKDTDKPKIMIHSTVPFDLKVIWKGGTEILHIQPD